MRSKKTDKHIIHDEQGIALITALLMLLVITAMGIAATNLSIVEGWLSANYRSSKQAFHVAEAGLELMKYYLRNDANTDSSGWSNQTFNFPPGAITVTAAPSTSYYPVTIASNTINVGGATGIFTIKLKNIKSGATFNDDEIIVESTGTIAGATAVIEAYLKMKDYGAWNNAIFAGSSASGTTIKGNADIRGSMHILGTGLKPTDYAVNMSGGAIIGNNYNDMHTSLKALIPSIGSPESLDAELRVKHGKVGLSGAATVGRPETTSSNKDTVSGTYVTDGFGGTAGLSSVYSDNGTGHAYDLGDDISFPSLNNPYTDPTTGTYYATYAAFLTAKAYVYTGDLEISGNTPTITIGDARGSISWDKTTGTLTISGLLKVVGKIDLANKNNPVTYNGKGTLYSTQSVYIHDNLLPSSGFPATNAMGLIATQDIEIATGAGESHLKAAGAFYAEGKIVSGKQNEILGTFVSNYFDMGSQVPSIYQVPSLARNLPPFMPGGNPSYVVTVKSWRVK
ncbi:MAG: pilus assembly PilX N-terminal domain-containing protein [Proteobacteria bacterium]|nr:pilus assembly PilX N-terminal domain-containing protein [Pseudomonadota bacterium]